MKRSDYRRRGDSNPEPESPISTDPNLRWVALKAPSVEKNSEPSICELLIKNQLDLDNTVQHQNQVENSDAQETDSENEDENKDNEEEVEDEWSRPLILVQGSSSDQDQGKLNYEELRTEPIIFQPQRLLTQPQPPIDHFSYLPTRVKPPPPPPPLLTVISNARLDYEVDEGTISRTPSISPPLHISMGQLSSLTRSKLSATKLDENYEYDDEVPSCSKDNKYDPSDALSLNPSVTSSFKLKIAQEYTNQRRDLKNYKYLSSEESENWDDDQFLTLNKEEEGKLASKSPLIKKPSVECSANNLTNNENKIVRLDCSWVKAGRVLLSNIAKGQKGIIDVDFKDSDSAIDIKVDTPEYRDRHNNSFGAQFSLNIPYDSVIAIKANANAKNRRNSYYLELKSDKCEEIRTQFELKEWQFGLNNSKDYSIRLFKFSTTGLNSKKEDLDRLKYIFGNRLELIDVNTSESYSNPKYAYYNLENNRKLRIKTRESRSRSRSPRRTQMAAHYFRKRSRSSSRSDPGPIRIPRRRSKSVSSSRRVRQRSSDSDRDHHKQYKSYKEVYNSSDNKSEDATNRSRSRSNVQILQGNEMNKLCSTSDKAKAKFNCYLVKFGICLLSAIGTNERGKINLRLSSSAIEIDVNAPQFRHPDGRAWSLSIPTSSVISLQVYSNSFRFKDKNTFFIKLIPEEMKIIRSKFNLSHQEYPYPYIESGDDNDDDDIRQYFSFCSTTLTHKTIKEDLVEMERIFQNRMKYIKFDVSEYYMGKRSKPRSRSRSRSTSRSRSRSLSRDSDFLSANVTFSCQLLSFGTFTAASIENMDLGNAETERNKIEIKINLSTIDIKAETTDIEFTVGIPTSSVDQFLVYGTATNSYCFLVLKSSACEMICNNFTLSSNIFNSDNEIKDIKTKHLKFLTSKVNDNDIEDLRRIFGKHRISEIDYEAMDYFLNGGIEPIKKGEKRKSQSSRRQSRSRSVSRRSDRKRTRSHESRSSKRFSSLPVIAPSTSPSLIENNSYFFTYQLSSVHFGGLVFQDEVKVFMLPSTKGVIISLKSTENEQVELRISHHNVKRYYLAEYKSDGENGHHDCLLLYFRVNCNKLEKVFSTKIGVDLSSKFNPESKDYKLCYIMLIIKTENGVDLEKKSLIIQAVLGDGCEFLAEGGENEKVLKRVRRVIRDNLTQ